MELKLGHLYMTAGINELVATNPTFAKHVTRCMNRYRARDWGEMDESDKRMNDAALESGEDRILAAYKHEVNPGWRIWILTEWDRSATTILFPGEY